MNNILCKNCSKSSVVKNGKVRGMQRFRCKLCGYNFILGDRRTDPGLASKKALATLLYATGKASYPLLARIFRITPAAVQKWLGREADKLPEPEVSGSIREMEIDEMWHFLKSKKTKDGSSKRWIVIQSELSPGLSAIVILQHSSGFTPKFST